LRSLGVETVDLYQLHASDMQTPMEETLAFLDDAVRAGKIHYVGLSNFTGWELQLFVSTAKTMGVQPPVTLQPQYSLLSREIEWEIVPAAIYNELGLLPWSPLAGGFLTGKYRRGTAPGQDTRAGSKKRARRSTATFNSRDASASSHCRAGKRMTISNSSSLPSSAIFRCGRAKDALEAARGQNARLGPRSQRPDNLRTLRFRRTAT
jgi:aryl-alcohol dehydrogenase-like predicted oxidoreductase